MRSRHGRLLAAALVSFLLCVGAPAPGHPQSPQAARPLRLLTLEDLQVDPLSTLAQVATVFLFTSVDCPVSNRYAPEVQRLHDKFAPRGVTFWVVYPNPAEGPDVIRRHLADYRYPGKALRDPDHQLVARTGVTITPEAAVYDRAGALVYRGRINNRYVQLGLERPAATVHDLDDALTALVAGKNVAVPRQPAVGCFIADFVHIHRQ